MDTIYLSCIFALIELTISLIVRYCSFLIKIQSTMKVSVLALLSTIVAVTTAFAPAASTQRASVAMNAEAEHSRKAFLGAAAASLFGVAAAGLPVEAMDQDNVNDPTEVWETGSPNAAAEAARMARYKNARNQMNSNFPPIKRLTLERKSPVTRLDINAPDFTAYKKTYPGLFKESK